MGLGVFKAIRGHGIIPWEPCVTLGKPPHSHGLGWEVVFPKAIQALAD